MMLFLTFLEHKNIMVMNSEVLTATAIMNEGISSQAKKEHPMNEIEVMLTNLLTIITILTYHDRDIRQHLSTSISLDMACIPSHLLAITSNNTYTNTNTNTSTVRTTITSSFLSSIGSLPIRYFKDSRLKHSFVPCLIMGCLEIDHHVQMMKYYKKDKYIRKYIEYQLRESEQVVLPPVDPAFHTINISNDDNNGDNIEEGADMLRSEEYHKRYHRLQKVYEVLPKSIWEIITLVWLDSNHNSSKG